MPPLPKVLITDNISSAAAEILDGVCEVVYEKKLSAEELLATIESFKGLMVRSASTVTAEVLAKGVDLQIVGRAGVGTDNIDLTAATKSGVVVVNSPEGNTVAAAEHTIAMLMALSRHIPAADASLKQGEWKRNQLTGVEVFGKTLGIVGLGKIGSRVAKAALALGMAVNVFDPFLSEAKAKSLGVNLVSLDVIWAEADYITLHVPKNKETTNLLNTETLQQCKPGVRIINCARGGIINEADLVAAIESGHVAGAALDVFASEPLEPDSPLLGLQNKVILTPHLGASTEEAQVNVALDVARQFRDFFTDGVVKNAVNIPMLRAEVMEPVKRYMPLAEMLGKLVRQVATGATQSVELVAKGTVADKDVSPLTLAALKGVLSTSKEGVNFVNAKLIAEEAGIKIKESYETHLEEFRNLLQLTMVTSNRTYTIAGTLIHDDVFRIVDLDGYSLNLEPSRHLLFTPHEDRPGMVGLVSSILGNEGINISAMQVARKERHTPGGQSIMIFNLDTPVTTNTLNAIQAQGGIIEALYLHL